MDGIGGFIFSSAWLSLCLWSRRFRCEIQLTFPPSYPKHCTSIFTPGCVTGVSEESRTLTSNICSVSRNCSITWWVKTTPRWHKVNYESSGKRNFFQTKLHGRDTKSYLARAVEGRTITRHTASWITSTNWVKGLTWSSCGDFSKSTYTKLMSHLYIHIQHCSGLIKHL